MIEPRAWISKDGRNALTVRERKEHDNPMWRWVLEKHWNDTEPLYTVADVLAALREVTSAMQRAGDDCAHELANHPKGMWYWSAIFLAMLDQFEKDNQESAT